MPDALTVDHPMSADSAPSSASTPTPPPGRVYEVLTTGEQIGEFTVDSCLAYDILGSLYHVTAPDGAAKTLFVLPKILSEDESFQRHFRDFREKLVHLTHPRILALGESQMVEGRICLIAEPCNGKSLPDYLGAAGIYPTFQNPQGIVRAQPSEASRDFTPEKVQKVAKDVLEALDVAHLHGLLHLNLTPSNMLLLENGDTKVIGFGLYGSIGTQAIELLVSAGIPPVSLGPRNVRLNTADIISPEMHLKQEPDARADIYAFGMSIYWLLTGLKPGANYRPPSGIVPSLNPGWDIFLARCLARERTKRYPNAKAALKDLENLSHLAEPGYADDHTKPGGVGTGGKPAGRKRQILLLGAGVLIAMAAAGTTFVLFHEPAVEQDFVSPDSPVKRHPGETPGGINLRITPVIATVSVSPGNARFGVGEGDLRLDAKPGTYALSVYAPEFVGQKVSVTVTEGKAVHRTVNLLKEAGILEITTAPGASVSLIPEQGSSIQLGLADANGKLTGQAAPGVYTILVEKTGCKAARTPGVQIANRGRVERTVTVEGEPASLQLDSNPPGAQVTLDGNDIGTTPVSIEHLKAGKEFTLVFSKESYRSVTRKVVLDAGEKRVVESGPMPPARGRFSYSVLLSGRTPKPEQLRAITIARNDDRLRERNWADAHRLPSEVTVGHYMLRVNHPDYEQFQTAFVVKDNETTKVEANLRALPARFTLAGLPEGLRYTLRINAREYSAPPAEIPADVPLHLEIEARDYETWSGDFTLLPRQDFVLKARMKRMGPPLPGKPYEIPYMKTTRLAWIPMGETRLGSPPEEKGHTPAEEPITRGRFTRGFWMSSSEITQEQYSMILDSNPSKFRGSRLPVESVSHADAMRFCKVLTRREAEAGRIPEGYEFRLPNEIEWEYACRAGTETPFAFGDTASASHGNFAGTYPASGLFIAKNDRGTVNVGTYPANAYGLFDMHGNVREWLLEPYTGHLPGGRKVDYNVSTGDSGAGYSARGGSWKTPATEARSASRQTEPIPASTLADDLGFRIVLAPAAP